MSESPRGVSPAADSEEERRCKEKERRQRLQLKAAILAVSGDVAGAEKLLANEGLPLTSIVLFQRVFMAIGKDKDLNRLDELLYWSKHGELAPPVWLEALVESKEQQLTDELEAHEGRPQSQGLQI